MKRPDKKKPRSGQPQGKNGHLLGANNGRCSLPQYTHPSRKPNAFDVDEHIRAARRAMGKAVVMLSGWPSKIRFSYFVGPDGKLFCRSERKGAR